MKFLKANSSRQMKYRMGFLVFTFSLHHCFLAGTQYNNKLGNDFHPREKWSKISILVLTLGMGTCPPYSRKSWDTFYLLFVCFGFIFVPIYISFQAVLWSRNNNSSHWNKNCKGRKPTLSSEQLWPSRACPHWRVILNSRGATISIYLLLAMTAED